jgi:two-component system, OmpR family, sensor kinase
VIAARIVPGSLRGRLIGALGVVLVVAFCATFIAVSRGTGSDLRHRVDQELAGEMDSLMRGGAPTRARTPAALAAAARAVLANEPFRASTRLLYEVIPGTATLTNESELLALKREPGEPTESDLVRRSEAASARVILSARPGYSTVSVPDAGRIRLLVRRVSRAGVLVSLGVGESLDPVEHAEHDVAAVFAVAGSLALLAALLVVSLVSSGVLRPLRRITATAARVDAGDLTPRLATDQRDPAEVRILAHALDHMLGRLADAFARQRAFAADASHELRTPLTAIRGQLEVLALSANPSAVEVRRVESVVRRELVRMELLVDDLLLLARSDEGPPPQLEEVNLGALAAEVLEGLRHSADRRFVTDGDAVATVRADPHRIARAIQNLVRNAMEHTDPGGLVRVVVEADHDTASVAVEDDGPGVPADQRDAIFDRFHRTDSSRSRLGGGAGLGLAIVRAIIEAHGGRVFAEVAPEGGARIGFALPRHGLEGGRGPGSAA